MVEAADALLLLLPSDAGPGRAGQDQRLAELVLVGARPYRQGPTEVCKGARSGVFACLPRG